MDFMQLNRSKDPPYSFMHQFFILFPLHCCLLSFYQNTAVILGKQSYHLKEVGTSLELR